MNSIFLILSVFLLYYAGYRLYARLIARQLDINPDKPTPAYTENDGVDFVPAKNWFVLFGHHFSSIAGAAPIVGPILAVSIWGWGPTILWIALGVVFIGGVHDFCSLMISVKHKGASIADITEKMISKRSRYLFLWFVWLTLILIIAVFVYLCAHTLTVKPEIVVPSLGLIPLAIIIGLLMYNLRFSQIGIGLIGVICLIGLIFLGNAYPISIHDSPILKWGIALLFYSFVASVTPVQILLQPRDFLSAYLLFFGLIFGYLGLFVTHSSIKFPAFIGWSQNGLLPLWPILFVTVACGAISGFHSLVASGTTSKQLGSELWAKRIGYGGMVAEGLVSLLALLVVATYFSNLSDLKEVLTKGGGPIAVFGIGYGSITRTILGTFGSLFGVIVLNAFILTTLDTATRIGRYLTQELFNIKNRYIATFIVIGISGWLGLSGKWSQIWPIFGSANQLIASLTLIVVTSWFLSNSKLIRYTLYPAIFMMITTTGALVYKIKECLQKGDYLLLSFGCILLLLALFVLYEVFKYIRLTRGTLYKKAD